MSFALIVFDASVRCWVSVAVSSNGTVLDGLCERLMLCGVACRVAQCVTDDGEAITVDPTDLLEPGAAEQYFADR